MLAKNLTGEGNLDPCEALIPVSLKAGRGVGGDVWTCFYPETVGSAVGPTNTAHPVVYL